MSGTKRRFLSVGECMIEFARTENSQAWTRNFAGDTFNTAWYFTHLSGEDWSTDYFTALGDDKVSEDMRGFMDKGGIGTDDIRVIPNKSPGLYTIDLDGAERSFCYWRDNSAARQLASDVQTLSAVFARADEIYFSGITLAILPSEDRGKLVECLGESKARGASVSFDPNIRPRLWPSAEEMKHWLEEAARGVNSRVPNLSGRCGFVCRC